MKLVELIAGLPIHGSPPGELEIAGINHDSRRVAPGELFVALPGERFDGRDFVPQAVERGAVAVVASGPVPAEPPVPWLEAEHPRELLAPLAARTFEHPDREITLAGVTGTNGKSTLVALLAAIFEAAGRPAGRLGTLGHRFRELEAPGERTTPEASDLYRTLRTMVDAGARAVAMEVSSHALAQHRVATVRFDLALFTNLTHDHLDFHGDLESYFAAKRTLFDQLKEGGRRAVHLADEWSRRLAATFPECVTSGDAEADVHALEAELTPEETVARLSTPAGEVRFRSRLLGRYNLENMLLAVAGSVALGLPPEAIAQGLQDCEPLPGRLEPVRAGQDFPVFIDFAHTPAALTAALGAVRELVPGRLILVFGCGGDRDRAKRGPMGRVAGELADLAVLTSDNPRSEDPLAIIRQIESGLAEGDAVSRVIPDRREAIRQAIDQADADSVVLIAGKGHEETQDLGGGEVVPFSDREEARNALEERGG